MAVQKQSILRRTFALGAIPASMLFLATPVTNNSSYSKEPIKYLTINPSPKTAQQNSVYGDISINDWNWARSHAVREALLHRQARAQFIANGGEREDFQWQRPKNIAYQQNYPDQKLLIIDLGHYDYTEGSRWPASGTQARNGMTEAQYVDIQGRALYNEAKSMGYRVVFIRAPEMAMRVTEFNEFTIEDRKTYYARVRGAQIDYIAHRLGFSPLNTRAVSLHMDRNDIIFEGENPDRLYGTAVHVNARSNLSIDFANIIAQRIDVRAHYVRGSGVQHTTTLALPKGAENIPTILLESEYMSDHPIAVQRRGRILNDRGQSWARWFMQAVENSFPREPQYPQTQIASNTVSRQSQNLQ